MNINAFLANWNGKVCDVDGRYDGQCMDIMNQFCSGGNGLGMNSYPLSAPTAYLSWLKVTPKFTKIFNTVLGVPKPGDIVYWNTKVGPAGHVAIFLSGNRFWFNSFDQNWPMGSRCHIQRHSYFGVVGWKRKK